MDRATQIFLLQEALGKATTLFEELHARIEELEEENKEAHARGHQEGIECVVSRLRDFHAALAGEEPK